MALLQFGTTLVFAVPPLWNNENQPDPNLRKAQAILGKNDTFDVSSAILFLTVKHAFRYTLRTFSALYSISKLPSVVL